MVLGGMFQVDPRTRPTVSDCSERLAEIAEANNIDLRKPLNLGMTKAPSAREFCSPLNFLDFIYIGNCFLLD